MLRRRPAIAEADADAGAGKVGLAAHLDPLSVQKGAAAASRREEFIRERVIDDPQHQFSRGDHSHRYAPERNAGQKIVRPVDRVDHPERSRIRVAGATLLTEKSVPREQVSKTGDDEIFAGTVSLAHMVLRALAVDPEQLPPGEIVSGEPARFAHHRLGCPQAIVKIDRIQRRQRYHLPTRSAGSTSCDRPFRTAAIARIPVEVHYGIQARSKTTAGIAPNYSRCL